jgi:hypothetical protein
MVKDMKRPYTKVLKEKIENENIGNRKTSTQVHKVGSGLVDPPSKSRLLDLRKNYCKRTEIESSTLQRVKKTPNKVRSSRIKSPMPYENKNQNVFTIYPKNKRKYFDEHSMNQEIKEEKRKIAKIREKENKTLLPSPSKPFGFHSNFNANFDVKESVKENSFQARARLLMFKEVRDRVTQRDVTNPYFNKERRSTMAGSLLGTSGLDPRLAQLVEKYKNSVDNN